MSGPFERNGITPAGIAVARIARLEGLRKVMEHLEGHDLLGDAWLLDGPVRREAVITEIAAVLDDAVLAASQEANAEVAEYEARALEEKCPKCPAQEGERCHDLRKVGSGFLHYTKHPHPARVALVAQRGL